MWRKAIHRDPDVDDSGEMMSYRSAVFCLGGGSLTLIGWLAASGLSLWAAIATVVLALLTFVGLTRVVAESGVATAVSPFIAA